MAGGDTNGGANRRRRRIPPATKLARRDIDAAGQAKALEVIDRNLHAQAKLIDDLLDMARIIRGTVRLEMHPVDLAEAIDSAVDAVRPAADP